MKISKSILALFVLLWMTLFFVAPTWAQTGTTATVLGTVTDPTGAGVPSASVVLRNKATNNQVTQSTSDFGQYTFVNVAPGEYEITVKKDGFRTANVTARIQLGLRVSF